MLRSNRASKGQVKGDAEKKERRVKHRMSDVFPAPSSNAISSATYGGLEEERADYTAGRIDSYTLSARPSVSQSILPPPTSQSYVQQSRPHTPHSVHYYNQQQVPSYCPGQPKYIRGGGDTNSSDIDSNCSERSNDGKQ